MDITRFYLLHDPERNPCIADVTEDAPYHFEKIRCPIKRGHARGRRNSPLDLVVSCDPAPDVIFTWMSECLIQEPVRLIFDSEALTGFSTRPAKAKIRKTGASIPVHELAITGWGGMAPEATGIREVERCLACGHLVYSRLEAPEKLIDIQNWDGSDFFMIWPLPRFRFVTERVVEVCERHGVTGVAFSQNWRISQMETTAYTPGRLSYYMPQDRARLLGGTLGID